jgi:hypothetical protein
VSAAMASIIVAAIAALGGIVVSILEKFRKENKDDHFAVREMLQHLSEDIHHVDEKLDEHINWHLEKND